MLSSYKKEFDSGKCHSVDKSQKCYAKKEEPEAKRKIFHYLEQANSQRKQADQRLPGAGEKGEWGGIYCMRAILGLMKKFENSGNDCTTW